MSVQNNKVTIYGGLQCTALDAPPIGVAATSAQTGYTDGDTASDGYKLVADSATALHADLLGDGIVLVQNPGPLAVTLSAQSQTLGPIPAGAAVPVPVSNGVVLKGAVASGTQLIGVTVVKTTPNA